MRVIHVAPTIFGSDGLFGGGERYPLELARALADHVSCRLVAFGNRPRVDKLAGGLEVTVLKPQALLNNHPAHPLATGMWSATREADVVHAHHMRSAPSRVAALLGRARRQHMVVTDHGLRGGDWAGLLPRLFELFLTVSRYSTQTLPIPQSKARVIYGGVDPDRFSPRGNDERAGVLFVGRITPHKGIDRLIEALPQAARLRIAGSTGHDPDPPERDYPALLTDMARGKDVRFLGQVDERDLPSLYRRAAVFALPSVHYTCYGKHVETPELLGLSVLEAMASATPVVCSRVGGLPEIVRHGETGYLVDAGDGDELNDRLAELLRNPRLARSLGANARALVVEEFTWRRCAERCLAAYDELTASEPE